MPEPVTSDLELLVLAGDGLRVVDLSARSDVSLGRDSANDVPIDHPSVSRRHAILRLGCPLTVEDLGSANGTLVHDKSAAGGGAGTQKLRPLCSEAAEIAIGESVLLGAVSLVVRRRQPASTEGLIVADRNMRELYAQAERATGAIISVLLLGETGVGKDVLARWIHARSHRAKQPFIALNCAALSESLLESELFGYEKGAFTGATQARQGLFEAAAGGTLFLDEVGELPALMQAKLLRVIEERAVLRIGARSPRPVDVRFIAATNRDLDAEVRAGRFRQDLFYRLDGLSLTIPPLRERPGELELLAHSFVLTACRQLERPPLALSEGALRALRSHRWPGNVRELRNVIDRAVVLCAETSIGPEHLPTALTAAASVTEPASTSSQLARPVEMDPQRFEAQLESLARARIVEALARCGGNQTQAAKLLGIARRTLVAQLVEFGIPRPRARGSIP
jgi:two-component system response regulator AtoC